MSSVADWSEEVKTGRLLDRTRPTLCISSQGVGANKIANFLATVVGFEEVRIGSFIDYIMSVGVHIERRDKEVPSLAEAVICKLTYFCEWSSQLIYRRGVTGYVCFECTYIKILESFSKFISRYWSLR